MAEMGVWASDFLLNALFRGSIAASPTTLYFSLGVGAQNSTVTELSGITRIAVPAARGTFSSTDDTYAQSSGTQELGMAVNQLVELLFTAQATQIGGTYIWVMIFSASTGATEIARSPIVMYNGTVLLGTIGRVSGELARGSTLGVYTWAMVADALFRGYDSINQLFGIGGYPNTYLNVTNDAGGTSGWVAVPRSTASWSAPTTGIAGTNTRKITNLNTITTAAITGSWFASSTIKFAMTSAQQSIDTTLFRTPVRFIACTAGDQLEFAPGALEVLYG